MRVLFLLLVAGACGWIVWMLIGRLQTYRGKLAADARARELLESWDDRQREAQRLDSFIKSDPRHQLRP
jgi:hypothetical protein